MAAGAMISVQLGLALSVRLAANVRPESVAWLRLVCAGAVLLVIVRPWSDRWDRGTIFVCGLLGLATGAMTLLFMEAATRLPLGTASALEFSGPLGVALVRGSAPARAWALPAAAGLVLLTRPWEGAIDGGGVILALCSGACWAGYILLTERASLLLTGLKPLGLSMPVAALAATVVVVPSGVGAIDIGQLPLVVVTAALVPLLPFLLELLALRRLPTATFSTTMSIEPAIAAVIGLLVLGQRLGALDVVGLILVVLATVVTEWVNRPSSGANRPEGLESALDRERG